MTTLARMTLIAVLGGTLALVGCSNDGSNNEGSGGSGGAGFDPFGDYGVFLSLVPPGSADVNGAMVEDPNSINQLPMYENLAFSDQFPIPGELSDDDLVPLYFKDEAFLPESGFDSVRLI